MAAPPLVVEVDQAAGISAEIDCALKTRKITWHLGSNASKPSTLLRQRFICFAAGSDEEADQVQSKMMAADKIGPKDTVVWLIFTGVRHSLEFAEHG